MKTRVKKVWDWLVQKSRWDQFEVMEGASDSKVWIIRKRDRQMFELHGFVRYQNYASPNKYVLVDWNRETFADVWILKVYEDGSCANYISEVHIDTLNPYVEN